MGGCLKFAALAIVGLFVLGGALANPDAAGTGFAVLVVIGVLALIGWISIKVL